MDKIHSMTAIDPWFLWKLQRIANMQRIMDEYDAATLPATTLLQAKKSGFSDTQIAGYIDSDETTVRSIRKEQKIRLCQAD